MNPAKSICLRVIVTTRHWLLGWMCRVGVITLSCWSRLSSRSTASRLLHLEPQKQCWCKRIAARFLVATGLVRTWLASTRACPGLIWSWEVAMLVGSQYQPVFGCALVDKVMLGALLATSPMDDLDIIARPG